MVTNANQGPPERTQPLECSVCKRPIENALALKCPHCGAFTRAGLKAESKKWTKSSIIGLIVVAAFFVMFLLVAVKASLTGESSPEESYVSATPYVGVTPTPTRPPTSIRLTEKEILRKPIEYQLACLNAGHCVSEDDPTIPRFRFLMDSISAKTTNSEQEIADISYRGVQALKNQYGKNMSLLQLMECMNTVIPAEIKGTPGYNDYRNLVTVFLVSLGNSDYDK